MMMDPIYWVIMGIGMLLSGLASMWVKASFSKWSKVPARRGLTGAQAAKEMLLRAGINDVRIEAVPGALTDHYDPSTKVIRLSEKVYGERSVAAIGVACHEAGHAIQHAQSYGPLVLRTLSVPFANFGGGFGPVLLMLGVFTGILGLAYVGVFLFAAVFLFQLFTLPVEINASRRAKEVVAQCGIAVGPEEEAGVSAVLRAAAFTYVAAMITTLLYLLYWAWRLGLIGGRR